MCVCVCVCGTCIYVCIERIWLADFVHVQMYAQMYAVFYSRMSWVLCVCVCIYLYEGRVHLYMYGEEIFHFPAGGGHQWRMVCVYTCIWRGDFPVGGGGGWLAFIMCGRASK